MDRVELVLRCLDLTSVEDGDTPERIEALCARAIEPAPGFPSVAAVCVLPEFVRLAHELVAGTSVRVACATGAFPSGVLSADRRVAEIRAAVDAGADEIDTVLDHAALARGDDDEVCEQMLASRKACGRTTMKVILETGALPDGASIRRAVMFAIEVGADFVKSSTGKAAPSVTPEACRAMCESIRDSDRPVGVKLSGGVRTTNQALGYLSIVEEVLGYEWLTPDRFRIGASALIDDLVARVGPKS